MLQTSVFPVDGGVDGDGNTVTGGLRQVNHVDPDVRRSAQLAPGRTPALHVGAVGSARRTA
jgi:hypothetical protein